MSLLNHARAVLERASRAAVNGLLPPLCLACRALVGEAGSLCAECWQGVDFLEAPLCRLCGFPFEYDPVDHDPGVEALCGACLRREPPYARGRAVLRYGGTARDIVLGFKHGDRTHGAPAFGRWLARAGVEMLEGADLVVPVPLHWARLLRRRYNQAALLARETGRRAGVPVVPDALVRRRATPSQGGLSAAARRRNVRGAFAVRRREIVRGKRVVLVDDVMTTGATVEACSRTLLRAGAREVNVLVLARVVRGAGD